MKKYRFISFSEGCSIDRFEYGLSQEISKVEDFIHEFRPSNSIYINGDNSAQIEHGSFHIVENIETKKFVIFDYGDFAQCSVKFDTFKNFQRSFIGQYNKKYLDGKVINFQKFLPGFYPEEKWEGAKKLIMEKGDSFSIEDERLFFRGNLYSESRRFINILSQYTDYMDMIPHKLSHEEYMILSKKHKISLCCPAGFSGGDICLRDVEMFGIGVPVLRPRYKVELWDNLIPDYHYLCVDCDVEETRNHILDHESLAVSIFEKFITCVQDDKLLSYISKNAMEWYDRNTGINLINKIVNKVRNSI